MDPLVLVERIEGGYRARTGEPLGIMAEARTEQIRMSKKREQINTWEESQHGNPGTT